MVVHSTAHAPQRAQFFTTNAWPRFASLEARLDAALIATPVVTAVAQDRGVEGFLRTLGLVGAGLVNRRIRLQDGPGLTVTAVPSAAWDRADTKASVLAFKHGAGAVGRRILLVPEGALDREPHLADALLIAECAGGQVAPSDRLALMTALVDAGGSMPLSDAAKLIVRSDDPVAAVLALVAARVVGLDLREPISPGSSVLSLSGRTWFPGARR